LFIGKVIIELVEYDTWLMSLILKIMK